MNNRKTENSSYTEWVQCPYCRQAVKAPNEAGVTFLCPNCGKELITYDKLKETEQIVKAKKQKQKQALTLGLCALLAIIAFLVYKQLQDKSVEQSIKKQGLTFTPSSAGKTTSSKSNEWTKIKEWNDLSYGDGGKYILYKSNNTDNLMIEFVLHGNPLQFQCQKYVVKANNEFLCHEPSDTPGGGRGDFYLAQGSSIYIIQNVDESVDDKGPYQVTGLLVMLDEKHARIFMNDTSKGRNYFMLYSALGN